MNVSIAAFAFGALGEPSLSVLMANAERPLLWSGIILFTLTVGILCLWIYRSKTPNDKRTLGGDSVTLHEIGRLRKVRPHMLYLMGDSAHRILLNAETAISTPGAFAGTPEFASPEQFAGIGADIRSDLYSLGITLCEMVTGKTPFRGTPGEVMYQH